MPERHTNCREINVGQLRHDTGVDLTRAKERLILTEAETFERTPDIHRRTPRTKPIILRVEIPVEGRAFEGLGRVTIDQPLSRFRGPVSGTKRLRR